MRLYLVRHGESVNNTGAPAVPDAPLTARGRLQAERLAATWRTCQLDTVLCSPLWRALETAEPVVRGRDACIEGWPELVERNRSYPTEGRSAEEVSSRFPWAVFAPPLETVSWPAYPGAESEAQAAARAEALTRRVAAAFGAPLADGGPRIALVGHQGFHGLLLRQWLRAPDVHFRLDNGHIHALDVEAGWVRLRRANASAACADGTGDAAAPGSGFDSAGPEGAADVYLIRHAQSTANLTGAREYDPPLTERGRAQAERLAAAFAEAGVGAVVCSPMLRALETAAPLAAAAGLPLGVWPDLVEYNGWDAYGTMSAADLRARYPGVLLPSDFPADGARFPGPEAPEAGWRRARRVLTRLRGGAGGPLAVVAHGTFLGMVLAAALGVAPDAPVSFQRDNAAVDRLRWEGGRLTLLAANAAEHLIGTE